MNDCNKCRCSGDGKLAVCTLKACLPAGNTEGEFPHFFYLSNIFKNLVSYQILKKIFSIISYF